MNMARGVNPLRYLSTLFRTQYTLTHEITDGGFTPIATRNKEKFIEIIKEKVARARNSEIAKKIKSTKGFYTLEMAPPRFDETQKLKADLALVKEFFQSGCYKYLTVKQAWLLFLVATEVGLWFFLGETIGKFHIVGYKV